MELDTLDIFILKKILKKERVSTWVIAKEYHWKESERFCRMGKEELKSFFSKKSQMIEYRLKQMVLGGFVLIEKNGEERFIVDSNRVKLGCKNFINGRKECVEIMFSDGKCVIFQV